MFPDPLSESFLEEGGRVATIETLVALKISSGVWGRRDQDRVPLRSKYLELLERSRLERELED